MKAPFLKITIHDNDFVNYYLLLGHVLHHLYCRSNPTKDDLTFMKPYIARLWWSIHNLADIENSKIINTDFGPTDYEYFEKHLNLDIVDYTDIPNWDNSEDIYISLLQNDSTILLV